MDRKIIHLDLDAFFCEVEQLDKPDLQGVPFAVGGKPEHRGVVSSCSYAARIFGIRSAMSMKRATQLCPDLIVIPPNHKKYQKISREIMDHLRQLSPLVEQISIDEAFLDVSDLPESTEHFANQLQRSIRLKFNLPCSLGAASNKLIAKIANDVGKSANRSPKPPNAITIVATSHEAEFLAPLPVIALWGVGPKTSIRLNELGIKTIGDLASWPESELVSQFGKIGKELSRHSRGIDDSPVFTNHETKSISQETTFLEDVSDPKILRKTLRELSDNIGQRLRSNRLSGKTIKLKIRWYDFQTFTRQITLPNATDQTDIIYAAVEGLFIQNWPSNKKVRLIGVGISGLNSHPIQLTLWDSTSKRNQRLQEAIDDLQNRFGKQSIRRGS